jgi:acetolactate synthase-1/2/3 large subunit
MAESYGATGLKVRCPEELLPTLKSAKTISGPVIIEIPVDYKDNLRMILAD